MDVIFRQAKLKLYVNWNCIAKSRCQHNILWILRENLHFHLETALKRQFFSVRLPSLIYFFLYRFIEYFKLMKYLPCKWKFHVNTDFLVNWQCEMVKFSLFYNHLYFVPKPRKTSQYLIKTDFPEGNHVLQN